MRPLSLTRVLQWYLVGGLSGLLAIDITIRVRDIRTLSEKMNYEGIDDTLDRMHLHPSILLSFEK